MGYLSRGPNAPQQDASDMDVFNASPAHSSFLQLHVTTPLLKGSAALATDHPQLQEHLSPLALQHVLLEDRQNTGFSQGQGGMSSHRKKEPPQTLQLSIPTTTHTSDLPPLK